MIRGLFFKRSLCTCEVEGKGDKAVVFAEDAKRLLPLHQSKEVICHRLTIEEVVHTQQEVPVGGVGGLFKQMYTCHSSRSDYKVTLCIQ